MLISPVPNSLLTHMKVLIAGSRDLIPKLGYIGKLLKANSITPTEIVSGGAKGVDTQAQAYAGLHEIPFKLFKADWDTHGKIAGHKRNAQMAEYSDILVLIWDGKSTGSLNMLETMSKLGKKIHVITKHFSEDFVQRG